jgi:hypothetical protein|tara:strand:- start:358 stop:627 length:270 start_codon:yes stop_codon:yes gene_type:complete
MEKSRSLWASTEEVCNAIGIGRTRLMDLKASGDLVAGKHWVYRSGRRNSPIGWDIDAIRDWQRIKSQEINNAPVEAAEKISSFQPMVEA